MDSILQHLRHNLSPSLGVIRKLRFHNRYPTRFRDKQHVNVPCGFYMYLPVPARPSFVLVDETCRTARGKYQFAILGDRPLEPVFLKPGITRIC
jgi:hypothetical protein